MLRTFALAALLGLVLLVGLDLSRREEPAIPPPVPALRVHAEPPAPQVLPPFQPPSASANAATETVSMPRIDTVARLMTRRRIAREGVAVYLDSMLARTDSMVTRWSGRADSTLRVRFIGDTALPGWTPAFIDDARVGMRAWSDNAAGFVLVETADTMKVDVEVRWATTLPDTREAGSTVINWNSDGVIHSATITLSMRRVNDSVNLPQAHRRRVAAHEFGHVLGLPHSTNAYDLMFPTSPVPAPSRRDQATLHLLYAIPPGPLRITP